MFESLSDRLTGALSGLRGKGRLTDADIDATAREIRLALLEADVSLPVVRNFIGRIKERAKGAEVSGALNPAQQVVKIVNEELIGILGGETRQLAFAKNPPTVIMLAGLQGSGKTTLAGKLSKWLAEQGHTPLLVACDLQRPGAVNQLQIVGERAGVSVFAPHPGVSPDGVTIDQMTTGDPVSVAAAGLAEAKAKHFDVVIVDTAGRLGIDEELMAQAAAIRDALDYDNTLPPVDKDVPMWDETDQKWKPSSFLGKRVVALSIPEAAFTNVNAIINGRISILSYNLPIVDFACKPWVTGHFKAFGVDLNIFDPFKIGCEVRLGDPGSGQVIGRGIGTIAQETIVTPHFSTPGAPTDALTMDNGIALINAGEQAVLNASLVNDGLLGAYSFNRQNAQLGVLLIEV